MHSEHDLVASMTRELRHIWDDKFKAIPRIFPILEEIRTEFPHFKPSTAVLRIKGLRHATEAQYWPAIERACEPGSLTLLINFRKHATCLVWADGSVDTFSGCSSKPWVPYSMLFFVMDEAAKAVVCDLHGNFQGEDKGQKVWAWLVEQMEEYRTDIRRR